AGDAPAMTPSGADFANIKFRFSIGKYHEQSFYEPNSIFVDRVNDEIYVVDTGKSEILILETNGTPIFKFGKRDGLDTPIDLVVRGSRIYVSQENKPFIEIFSLRGEPMGKIFPEGVEFSPGRMDIDEQGNIYVVNRKDSACLVIDKEDRFVRTIGEGLESLVAVAAGRGRVYLITPFASKMMAVHVYGADGTHEASFEAAEGKGGTLGLPTAGKVDAQGNLWLVDAQKGIIVFDRNLNEVFRLEFLIKPEFSLLNFPTDIDFDGKGMVYIMEKGAKVVSVLK
ncbi:MAG: hypothetical protein WA162_03230, partial [Thermodesulfobacteriota bacterium]